jgi:holo-[acyl-carrier protein] synthase
LKEAFILRCGTDLVDIAAFQRRVERSRNDFVGRYWTERERQHAGSRIESFAVRWAAKEAVMKALGVGIGKVDPTDIEIITRGHQPAVQLHRNAAREAEQLNLTQWAVSLTHEGGWAMAFVVALGGNQIDK